MRPQNLKFPQVFHKFSVKGRDSNEIEEYRIQDLPEDLYETALELYAKDYLPDEILSTSRDILNNKIAFDEFMSFWRGALKEQLTLACFRDKDKNCKELVALIFSS